MIVSDITRLPVRDEEGFISLEIYEFPGARWMEHPNIGLVGHEDLVLLTDSGEPIWRATISDDGKDIEVMG